MPTSNLTLPIGRSGSSCADEQRSSRTRPFTPLLQASYYLSKTLECCPSSSEHRAHLAAPPAHAGFVVCGTPPGGACTQRTVLLPFPVSPYQRGVMAISPPGPSTTSGPTKLHHGLRCNANIEIVHPPYFVARSFLAHIFVRLPLLLLRPSLLWQTPSAHRVICQCRGAARIEPRTSFLSCLWSMPSTEFAGRSIDRASCRRNP